jgi:hypothetical protein
MDLATTSTFTTATVHAKYCTTVQNTTVPLQPTNIMEYQHYVLCTTPVVLVLLVPVKCLNNQLNDK